MIIMCCRRYPISGNGGRGRGGALPRLNKVYEEDRPVITIALLICSNIFMTFAWYGHLKFRYLPLWEVILISWLIAFPEYCFQVPANRWGYGQFTAVELKTIQEVISLTVFSIFSVLYLNEQMRWNYLVGFALLAAGAYFIFKK